MKLFLALILTTAAWSQITQIPITAKGGGFGAPNIQANVAGPATTTGAIDITSLALTSTSLNSLQATCWTGTGYSSSLVTGNLTPLACSITTRSTSAVTVTFTSSSNVLVVLNSNGGAGPAGSAGTSVTATVESPGGNCTTGGVKFVSASGTNYACNGTTGTDGTNGTNGTNGAAGSNGTNGTSVTVTAESAGANCTYGGEKLVGASGTSYVCNGAPGSGTGGGSPLVAGVLVTTGSTSFTVSYGATIADATQAAPSCWLGNDVYAGYTRADTVTSLSSITYYWQNTTSPAGLHCGAIIGGSGTSNYGQITIPLTATAGQVACGRLPYSGTITGGLIVESSTPPVSSSAVVDVWTGTYQPTVSQTITTGGTKPTLSASTNAAISVSGWSSVALTKGQWVCGHVDSSSSAAALAVMLDVTRSN